MIFSRRLTRLFKVFLIVSTTFVFLKLVTYNDDNGTPIFDKNSLPTITLNDSIVLGAQNTAILNLSNEPNFSSPIDQKTIIESMKFLNEHHRILNVEQFGELNEKSVSVVIVVQVHNRYEYLSFLIESLRNVQGINQTLVVFSHDINSPEINALIQNITFCRVSRIMAYLF
jgi:hypothetical protein